MRISHIALTLFVFAPIIHCAFLQKASHTEELHSKRERDVRLSRIEHLLDTVLEEALLEEQLEKRKPKPKPKPRRPTTPNPFYEDMLGRII